MKCQICGAHNDDGFRFCGNCGKLLVSPGMLPAHSAPVIQTDVSPRASSSSSLDIYLFANNEERGPYTLAQVRAMWVAGHVNAQTLYWHEGMLEWQAIPALLEPGSDAVTSLPTALPDQVRYVVASDSFIGTLPLMMQLGIRAVRECGYLLTNSDEKLGIITFSTGLAWQSTRRRSCSIAFRQIRECIFRMAMVGKQGTDGGFLSAIDVFDETKAMARMVIRRMQHLAE
jgi:hypothetical protein